MKKILVILGPTATGKTDLALGFAEKFNGELISCDSRQVYIGLDIGSGKDLPLNSKFKNQKSKLQLKSQKSKLGYYLFNTVPVWMLDVINPKLQYTVADYVKHANIILEDVFKRDKLPIIVGGTGLYLKALLEGLPNLIVPVNEQLREELEQLSLSELQRKLQLLSPAGWKKLNESDNKNPRRLLRSIELVSMNSYIKTTQNSKVKSQNYNALKIGLTAPREILKKRIFNRLSNRIGQGLKEEGKHLHKNGLSFARMRELGLEYGMLADLLEEKITENQFKDILGRKICQYAKRQMTWFNKEKDVFWFDINKKNQQKKMDKLISKWYHE